MCVGWASAGPPCTDSTTLVCLSPLFVSVAVPDSPDPLCGARFTVIESAACAVDAPATSASRATMERRARKAMKAPQAGIGAASTRTTAATDSTLPPRARFPLSPPSEKERYEVVDVGGRESLAEILRHHALPVG